MLDLSDLSDLRDVFDLFAGFVGFDELAVLVIEYDDADLSDFELLRFVEAIFFAL